MKTSLSQLKEPLDGELYNSDSNFNGISIDSRTIKPNNLFVAIKGHNFDGHNFIDEAITKGASAIICERKIINVPQLIVKDTIIALGVIAQLHINKLKPISIGITGTNGKTSVTKLIYSMLNWNNEALTNFGNFNNHIGVPLSVLELSTHQKHCVIEMGASIKGDIKYLCEIIRPKIVALLNVSAAHMESFENFENILLTKEEILLNQGFTKTVILNKDDINFERWKEIAIDHNIITISKNEKADYSIQSLDTNKININLPDNQLLQLSLKEYHINFIENILFSVACSHQAGATIENIVNGYNNYKGVKGRFYIYELADNSKVIDDTYNANPSSMKKSLDSLSSMSGDKWFVMGDMGELGAQSEEFHQDVIEYAKKNKIDKLFYIGKHDHIVKKTFGDNAYCFDNKLTLIKFIQTNMHKNVNILVKASRFMKFEDIVIQLVNNSE
ncbi:MAG: hypothetical protein CMD65_04315 [Gammaproteobacteria bacterium]|nr:hypothetical protein [Gammaproteobacteria bacterium]|tara:strand:+ start:498 stop:1832 length:1335 start_codon:yes stop_codon:yes gene_type:complete